MYIWDFGIIDEMYKPDQIIAHIDALTPVQRKAHAWMTGTLDVVYPFAYGSFFIGMAKRHFIKHGNWLAIPSVLVIPFDLFEGLTQIILLNGNYSVVGLKQIFTPVKLGLFSIGLAIALAAIIITIYRFISGRKT